MSVYEIGGRSLGPLLNAGDSYQPSLVGRVVGVTM
jgi:hypothetical protein